MQEHGHLQEPETESITHQEPTEASEPLRAAPRPQANAYKWVWIALAGAGLGMCILCGGALTMLGLLGALSSERSQAQMAPQPSFGGASAGGGFMPYDYSAPSIGYPYSGSDFSAFPHADTGGSDFLDSLRQSDAERSWWSEEWSRALGDNYPEPTHVDPDGNPGWVDSSGAFHDYNSGMSDYEASTLGGGGE